MITKINLVSNPIESAVATINQEILGLQAMINFFDENFVEAIKLILMCQQNLAGRIILSGMGKSGHIANKIAATLSSTGTPSFFLHPAEASHGDLGMITRHDLLILLSNSGENREIQDLIYFCKKFSVPIIAITRNANSELAKQSNITLALPNIAEANLVKAPTTSTTMMLALGDAIAVSLMNERHFCQDDYRNFHPGGKLGIDLLKAKSIMRTEKQMPIVLHNCSFSSLLLEITSKCLGCVAVLNDNSKLIGIVTDGDLRRYFANNTNSKNLFNSTATEIMTANPITINENMLAIEAIKLMNQRSITSLFVLNNLQELVGILHLHDCIKMGIN